MIFFFPFCYSFKANAIKLNKYKIITYHVLFPSWLRSCLLAIFHTWPSTRNEACRVAKRCRFTGRGEVCSSLPGFESSRVWAENFETKLRVKRGKRRVGSLGRATGTWLCRNVVYVSLSHHVAASTYTRCFEYQLPHAAFDGLKATFVFSCIIFKPKGVVQTI